MRNIILIALMLTFLSGCSIFGTRPIKVSAAPVDRIPLVVPSVDPYTHREVKWTIVTPENAEKVFAELKKKGRPVVLFTLTEKGYQALSLNVGDQIKITKQQQAIIEAYQKYYLQIEKRDEEHNKREAEKAKTQK